MENKTFLEIIIVITLIAIVGFLLLALIPADEYYSKKCDELNGQLVYYECYNIPFGTPCSELKTGYWCDLLNGTEVKIIK